jgi:hypothetical protein
MLRLALAALGAALSLSGCYLSHRLGDRVDLDAGAARDGSPSRIDGSIRDASRPVRPDGGEACPILRYQPLDRPARPLIADDPGDPIVTVVGDSAASSVLSAEVRWALDGVAAFDAITEIPRVMVGPRRARGRTWLFGWSGPEHWMIAIEGGEIRARPALEGRGTHLAFDGETALRWWRDGAELVIVRSSADADERLPVIGDPALVAILDPAATDPELFHWDGALVARGRSYGTGASWIARLDLDDRAARLTHAISQPALPNPYRSATAAVTADRLYTADSTEVSHDVVIRELDTALSVLREEVVTLGMNTGSCELEVIGAAVALFCSVGVSGDLVVHRPFAGGDWVTIPYVPDDVSATHALDDLAWVDEHRALVSSSLLEEGTAALSLICVP